MVEVLATHSGMKVNVTMIIMISDARSGDSSGILNAKLDSTTSHAASAHPIVNLE
jgi:hypothetical protein